MKDSPTAAAEVMIRIGTLADAPKIFSLIRGLVAHEGFVLRGEALKRLAKEAA